MVSQAQDTYLEGIDRFWIVPLAWPFQAQRPTLLKSEQKSTQARRQPGFSSPDQP